VTASVMRPARPIHSWTGGNFPKPLNKVTLHTSDVIRNELIASVTLYSEVEELGRNILKHGHSQLLNSFRRFQAYMRQGRTFYESAEVLPARACPLNYYYSFLNFAKAFILLRSPTFIDNNLKHGLSPGKISAKIKQQHALVNKSGVFLQFYHQLTQKHLAPGSKLKIIDLLSYCSDVGYEYEALKYGLVRAFPVKFVIAVNQNGLGVFPIFAVGGTQHRDFAKIHNVLTKTFDIVDVSSMSARDMFKMMHQDRNVSTFFESKNEYPLQNNIIDTGRIISDTIDAVQDIVSYRPLPDDALFVLNTPIRTPKAATMNEFVAIYVIMFLLGSLVRYRPEILEKMLSSKDTWLIERFVKTAPITLLRHFRNLVEDNYIAYATM
jgi:hypothetical protein